MSSCCPSSTGCGAPKSLPLSSGSGIYAAVQRYYGHVLAQSSDLQTNSCCTSPPPTYLQEYLKRVPQAVLEKFYGCGNPIPPLTEGLSVLDLGCGSGRDCFVAAAMVGEAGTVTGIDMTEEQLAVGRQHADSYCIDTLGYSKSNLSFVRGYIEFLVEAGVPVSSKDVVISNCVVNLSPNKRAVLQSVYNVLRNGGEFYFSDVYADRRIPKRVRENELMYAECLAGALYEKDFVQLCLSVGFLDPRVVSRSPIDIGNQKLKQIAGEIKFESITFRLFKFEARSTQLGTAADECEEFPASLPTSTLSILEMMPENFGQSAMYLGTIPHHPKSYALDGDHKFDTGTDIPVSWNTALMVGQSRTLSKHFSVFGTATVHLGSFQTN